MARAGRPERLRLFRDGRFVDEQAVAPAPLNAAHPAPPLAPPPPTAPSLRQVLDLLREHASENGRPAGAPAPLLPAGSVAGKVLGWGCLVVVLLPLLLATLFFLIVTAAFAFDEETRAATAVVTSVGPGHDAFGPRPWCYEVRYEAADGPRTHHTCDVLQAGISGTEGAERERAEARFAAAHPVGTVVQVLQDVDPPSYAQGAIADAEGSRLMGGGPIGAVVGAVGALVTGGLAAAVLWFAVWSAARARAARRAAPAPGG